ncbi:ComEA family DNA-binding protein [Amycolatopsis suaedae]|uniref:ComEA family DNA-binding protein n=1 Tax=Amycolatopsis suaedae TaxID=2510978 RepID=A0A4Q7J359_9PSEU|nr:ComEA family DNA-binding protein [Amycolatopsis suaedae]RZQ60414.1 ComEA family DNA-binding protein [Amycolatopsis suaedae]
MFDHSPRKADSATARVSLDQLARAASQRPRFLELLRRWLPGADGDQIRRRLRAALVVLAVCAVVLGSVLLLRDGPAPEQAPALPPARASPAPPPPAGPPETIVVSVAGKVAAPGLVTLPAGARAADALRAAGGPLPGVDPSTVNLARRLVDGEQLHVGVPPAVDTAAGGAMPGGPPGKVDLNTATLRQLDDLPGIGQVTAQRILDWRTAHGRFASVEQLREVDGIGETRLARLRDQVVVP